MVRCSIRVRLANIWRLLSVISSVAGVVTVVSLLVSVHQALVGLIVVAGLPGLVTARSRRHYNLLVTDTERYRRLANTVSEVLRDPGQAVEVRAFGLYETLTEVARRAFDAYRMLFTVSLRRYAVLSALAWVAFGVVYILAGLWLFARARAGENSIGARIKQKLIRECNLHTIVRLPQGVFAPYTQIPSNLLFFEKGQPTQEVWFYEISLPDGRRGYTKTKPMQVEEFEPCVQWWGGEKRHGREEGPNAWKVSAVDIEEFGYNLDLANPHVGDDLAHRTPQELVDDLIKTEREILGLLEELRSGLGVIA